MNDAKRLVALCGACLVVAYVLVFAAMRQPQPVGDQFTAAGQESSPTTDPTQQAFRKAVLEWMAGTETPTPTEPAPPIPTATAPVRCSAAVPPGRACVAATAAPTPPPASVVPPPTPYPTWPGEAAQTPGATYVMPLALPTPPAMYWNLP